jgi:adenylate kinase family enzyme
MQRIVILGCSGTGKSTLARRLGERLRLPVVHLDALFWEPGWVEAERQLFRSRVAHALAGERWISDGNYTSRTADLRLPRADLIVWLDQPLWRRLWRVTWRVARYRRGSRPDMGPDCPERLDPVFLRYIWDFDRKARPRIEALIAEHAPATPLLRLRGDRQVAAFLAGLRAPSAIPADNPNGS